jgi:hypothetical protein
MFTRHADFSKVLNSLSSANKALGKNAPLAADPLKWLSEDIQDKHVDVEDLDDAKTTLQNSLFQIAQASPEADKYADAVAAVLEQVRARRGEIRVRNAVYTTAYLGGGLGAVATLIAHPILAPAIAVAGSAAGILNQHFDND